MFLRWYVLSGTLTSDACTYVEHIEYLSEIPTLWPVPRVPIAYVLDLSHEKFNLHNKDGHLIPLDTLVKRQDNDSWHGNSGSGNNPVDVMFEPGATIFCRRSRNDCSGCHACSAVDPALLELLVRA
ncbi:hypothetical protein B0H10DRAFT_512454 [Mycena sp. CBHHK59/15]|nr:hypothetical protein B0H10DRAFT_512454 [Mycena sp. CBHHK59/15]